MSPVKNVFYIAFSTISYTYFFWVFLCFMFWQNKFVVVFPALAPMLKAFPYVMDMGPYYNLTYGMSYSTGTKVVVNLLLLNLFYLQHSLMARTMFKEKILVLNKRIERPFYVLLSAACLHLSFALWMPLPTVIYDAGNVGRIVLLVFNMIGWNTLLMSTYMIDHFELFGLRQGLGKFKEMEFVKSGLYKYIRHPIMTGFLIAFSFNPILTVGG